MSNVETVNSLKQYLREGFEVKTAYANKGMHFLVLQKDDRILMATTNSINIEHGNDVYYENYDVRELTVEPS